MTDRATTSSARLALVAVILLVVSACSSSSQPDPAVPARATAQAWVDALTKGDLPAAAALTDAPVAAQQTLQQVFAGLDAPSARFTVDSVTGPTGDTAGLATTWNWDFGNGHTWVYSTAGDLVQGPDDTWKLRWAPTLVHPQLQVGQSLRYSVRDAPSVAVTDRSGTVLMNQQVVTVVVLDPTRTTTLDTDLQQVAAALAPIDPTITAASLRAQLDATPGQPVTAITLRQADATVVGDALGAVPLVSLQRQQRVLTTPRTLTSPALDALPDLVRAKQAQADGWEVTSVDPGGAVVTRLAGADPSAAGNIRTTLDLPTQDAALSALASVPQQAALVALQPSTGQLLAVAQNGAADAQGPIALTGLYPPGSTFKTVTATAALTAGTVTPETPLACPGTATIETRTIPNEDSFDLGTVPLRTAFAKSCNTTFAALADQLPDDALPTAAAQLGLGVDYVVPGVTTVTGTVPTPTTPAERVESGIGQGQVVASPFGMALVASTLASGTLRSPTLLADQPGTPDRTPAPLADGVAAQVRGMMAQVVASGTASQLADVPGVIGKTGTAEFGSAGQSHGWFVAVQGDLALAVLVVDGGSSTPAVEAAGRFLRTPR